MTVTQACAELSAWLLEHLPELHNGLRPPASDEDWRAFCEALDQPLPDELRELYAWHDGQESKMSVCLFYDIEFSPLERVEYHWLSWAQAIEDEAGPEAYRIEGPDTLADHCTSAIPGLVRHAYASLGWIPFAHDGGGNHLAIDLDPGELGTRGQVINIGPDEERKVVLGDSLAAFLEWYVGQLKVGNFVIKESYTPGERMLIIKEPEEHECFTTVAQKIFGPQESTP